MIEDKEPTVLDFVKGIIMPWKYRLPQIPPLTAESVYETQNLTFEEEPDEEPADSSEVMPWLIAGFKTIYQKTPWATSLSLVLAVLAQFLLEPSFRTPDSILAKIVPQILNIQPDYHYVVLPILIYFFSAIFLIVAVINKEWRGSIPEPEESQPFSMKGSWFTLGITAPILLVISFLTFHFSGSDALVSNEFTPLNVVFWLITIGVLIWLMWLPEENGLFKKLRSFFQKTIKDGNWRITISGWALLIIVIIGISIFFRVHQFVEVPKEMFSDQAEKLWDVGDVLAGKHSIFFPRNTGREGFQMYLTALIITLLGTGLTFTSLKIGTVLAGIVTLPYIYRLGKELGNQWVGALAMLLAGIAYWPNLISRIGLRFPLYPLFVAPCLFYLFRGIRRSKRNDFIFSGIALGIGLHGYSPMRIVPFVVVIGVAIYLLHQSAKGKRWQTVAGLGILALVSFVIFLPLFNYMMANLDMFGLRAFSRVGEIERPYPAPIWEIFFYNLKNASLMFFWDDGSIWVNSVPYRPSLDFISGALFFIGVIYLIIRYVQKRNWNDLFLLLCVPLLELPSILSLAFPDENPALNRAGGAIVPVFIIAAIGFEGVLATIAKKTYSRKAGLITAWAVGIVLVLISCNQNYKIMFNDFKNEYDLGTLNTSEIGRVVRGFVDSVGFEDSAYVIPYPYWVDTRLVGINAGFPTKDYALQPSDIEQTKQDLRTKLFIYNQKDDKAGSELQSLYPNGTLSLYKSEQEGKDFYVFLVPGTTAK